MCYKAVMIKTVWYWHNKQTLTSMELSVLHNKRTQKWTHKCMANQSLTKQERIPNGIKSLQQMVLGKLDSNMQKNEPSPVSFTIHKNKLKMEERPKCKTGSHENPRGENRQKPL